MCLVEATTELVVEMSESASTEPTIIPESPVIEQIGTKEKVEKASSAGKNVCTETVSKQKPPQSKVLLIFVISVFTYPLRASWHIGPRGFCNNYFLLWERVISPLPNHQPGGQVGSLFIWPNPSTCLAWLSLPGVQDNIHCSSSSPGACKPPHHAKVAIPIKAVVISKTSYNCYVIRYHFSGFVKVTIAVFPCSRRNRVLRNNLTISMVIPEMILK